MMFRSIHQHAQLCVLKTIQPEEKNTVFPNNLHFKVSCKMKGDPVPACGDRCNGKTSLLTTLRDNRHMFEDDIYFLGSKKQSGVEILYENIWSVIYSRCMLTVTCLFVFPGLFVMHSEIEGSESRPRLCYSETVRLSFSSNRGDKV